MYVLGIRLFLIIDVPVLDNCIKFLFFETESHCTVLANLELAVKIRLPLTQRTPLPLLPHAETKGVCHHNKLCSFEFNIHFFCFILRMMSVYFFLYSCRVPVTL